MTTTKSAPRFAEHKPKAVRRRHTGSLLLTFGLAAGACTSSADNEAQPEADPTTTVTAAPTENEAGNESEEAVADPAMEEDEAEETPAGPARFDAAAPLFTDQFSPVDIGTHRFDNLGTEFSITTDTSLMVQPNSPGHVVLTSPSSFGPGDSDIIFVRHASFYDPADPGSPDGAGWDGSDIDGWIAAADSDLLITDDQLTTIGDAEARRFDVTLADGARCGPEECAYLLTNRVESIWFDPGHTYRVWLVPQGDEQPIAVVAGAGPDDDEWLDEATSLVDRIAFGPTLPSPIPADGDLWELGFPADIPAGSVTLPLGPGITFELDEGAFTWQRPNFAAIVADAPAENDLVLVTETFAGPVTTAAEIVTFLVNVSNFNITATSEVETAGTTATRLTFEAPQVPLLYTGENRDFETWTPPVFGVLWLLDTEAGPLMITAESFEDEATLDLVLPRAELIVETLQLG